MFNIQLLLHSRLVKDALAAVLLESDFLLLDEQRGISYGAIAITDFGDCRDREVMRLLQSQGAKIVALADATENLEISADDLPPLSGILTHSLSADAFVQSLRRICSGERVFPRDLVLGQPSLSSSGSKPTSGGIRFSPRERAVLSHVVKGFSNKLIARQLGISEATAKVHMWSVLRKIHVGNRTEAAVWALANLPELNSNLRGFV